MVCMVIYGATVNFALKVSYRGLYRITLHNHTSIHSFEVWSGMTSPIGGRNIPKTQKTPRPLTATCTFFEVHNKKGP